MDIKRITILLLVITIFFAIQRYNLFSWIIIIIFISYFTNILVMRDQIQI